MEKQTQWALDRNGKAVHISEVERGNKEFYCPGCKTKKSPCINTYVRAPHFRHYSLAKHAKHCGASSDETLCHNKAKEIIQLINEIKVPSIRIVVPEKYGGGFARLEEPKYLRAHKILIEHYLYEKDGEVCIQKEPPKTEFFIRPDILFVDFLGKPELIVEVCVTHKVDKYKLNKIYFFGVNAVEVRIPGSYSSKDIENCFRSVKNTTWLYNHKQITTEYDPYIFSSFKHDNDSSNIKGEFLGYNETFECRKFRIKEAIRGIRGVMESDGYTRAARILEKERGRIEREEKAFEREEEEIESEEGRAEGNERKIKAELQNEAFEELRRIERSLEERYNKKSRYIERKQAQIERILLGYKELAERRGVEMAKDQYRFNTELQRIRKEEDEFSKKERGVEEYRKYVEKQLEGALQSEQLAAGIKRRRKRFEELERKIREEISGIATRKGKLGAIRDESFRR